MAFNVTSWKQRGRGWSRGEPPPRGSIEYVAVGDMWEPEPPRAQRAAASGVSSWPTVWEISATEVDAADRWCKTVARSVDYARRVHGDKVLSAADAAEFTTFYKRWLAFSKRVGTWSLIERAKESNKKQFETLLGESLKLWSKFKAKGAALIPVPRVVEIVLLLRTMPKSLDTREMAARLRTGAKWGDEMVAESAGTAEWVQRAGIRAAGAVLLGPAGYLFARQVPSSWDKDRTGLRSAIEDTRTMAAYLDKERGRYERGEPVYDEFLRGLAKIYVEAAGLYGIRETERSNTAQLVDDLTKKPADTGSSLLWLLLVAGVGYLGVSWVTKHGDRPPAVRVPDAMPNQGDR